MARDHQIEDYNYYGNDEYTSRFQNQNFKKLNLKRNFWTTNILSLQTQDESISHSMIDTCTKGKTSVSVSGPAGAHPNVIICLLQKREKKSLGVVTFIYISIDMGEQNWKKSEQLGYP
jgi:hypothetical protein